MKHIKLTILAVKITALKVNGVLLSALLRVLKSNDKEEVTEQ